MRITGMTLKIIKLFERHRRAGVVFQCALAYAFAIALIASPLKQFPDFATQTMWCVSAEVGNHSDASSPAPSHHEDGSCCLYFCQMSAALVLPATLLVGLMTGAGSALGVPPEASGQTGFPPAAFSNPRAPPQIM